MVVNYLHVLFFIVKFHYLLDDNVAILCNFNFVTVCNFNLIN